MPLIWGAKCEGALWLWAGFLNTLWAGASVDLLCGPLNLVSAWDPIYSVCTDLNSLQVSSPVIWTLVSTVNPSHMGLCMCSEATHRIPAHFVFPSGARCVSEYTSCKRFVWTFSHSLSSLVCYACMLCAAADCCPSKHDLGLVPKTSCDFVFLNSVVSGKYIILGIKKEIRACSLQ